MRRFAGKELGYIIVPVLIDEDSDEPSDDAFDQIITVVSALAMEDERIIEEFKSIASGKRSEGRTIVEIDVPEYVRIELGDLLENIETRIWGRLGFGWEKGFERLEAYVAKTGDAKVPAAHIDDTGFKLGMWVNGRRQDYKKAKLSMQRILRLEEIQGWTWDVLEDSFRFGFDRLGDFVGSSGHARVPRSFLDHSGYRLGEWVKKIRSDYFAGRLSAERASALEALPGWSWDPREDRFCQGLARLRVYVTRNGHSRVPATYIDETEFKLGNWVTIQHQNKSQGKLTQERIDILQSLPSWSWGRATADFDKGLERLRQFATSNNHTSVPYGYRDESGFQLGNWVRHYRSIYQKRRRGNLTADRIAALEAVPGWIWREQDPFEVGLEHLKKFVASEGHARVPAAYKNEAGFRLGGWVAERRSSYQSGRVSADRIAALEAVPGWIWREEDPFKVGLEHLKKFVASEGHARVPVAYADETGFNLGGWVRSRRQDYADNNLTTEKILILENLVGWVWDTRENIFEKNFPHLKEFTQKEGHARVPSGYVNDAGFPLGNWIGNLRASYKRLKLSPEKIQTLEALPGWMWDSAENSFQVGLRHLRDFVDREGHASVIPTYTDATGYKLGSWVVRQRQDYRRQKLSSKQISMLESVQGWTWAVRRAGSNAEDHKD
jgi:hypothetical protein